MSISKKESEITTPVTDQIDDETKWQKEDDHIHSG